MKTLLACRCAILFGLALVPTKAFQGGALFNSRRGVRPVISLNVVREDKVDNKLLDDFRTSWGEFIDPYKTLKVNRDSPIKEVKKAYYSLSKRYHPDGRYRFKGILPGSCNNMEEVRDEWERIRMSYEILSDKRLRKKYERNTAIADPQEAVKRAAMDAAWNGVTSVGKGVFDIGAEIGAFAMDQITKKDDKKSDAPKP